MLSSQQRITRAILPEPSGFQGLVRGSRFASLEKRGDRKEKRPEVPTRPTHFLQSPTPTDVRFLLDGPKRIVHRGLMIIGEIH